jgi:hypothetical protein
MSGIKPTDELLVIRTQLSIYRSDLPGTFARLEGAPHRRHGKILLRLLAEAEDKSALAAAIGRAASALNAPEVPHSPQPSVRSTTTGATKVPTQGAPERGTLFDELAAMNSGASAGLGGKA